MQKYLYDLRFKVDRNEWRSIAKRDLIFQLYRSYSSMAGKQKLLDFGCGTGVLQDEFAKKFPLVSAYGIDISQDAIKYCKQRGLKNISVFDGKVIPFKDNTFDIITAIDVLEHVKDDYFASKEIFRVLKPGGLAIILVPAHQSLWSTRDIRLQHYRRYSLKTLTSLCRKANFQIICRKNVDFALFFLLFVLCKTVKKRNGVPALNTETGETTGLVNTLLYRYEMLENFVQRYTTFPIGTSIVVVITKDKGSSTNGHKR